MVGTLLGVAPPSVPMPSSVTLANDGFLCGQPSGQGTYIHSYVVNNKRGFLLILGFNTITCASELVGIKGKINHYMILDYYYDFSKIFISHLMEFTNYSLHFRLNNVLEKQKKLFQNKCSFHYKILIIKILKVITFI